jgi:hypothetical protein
MKKIICLSAFLSVAVFAFSQDAVDSFKRKIVDREIERSGIKPTVTRGEVEAVLDILEVPKDSVRTYIVKVRTLCNGNKGTGERLVVIRNDDGKYIIGHQNQAVPYKGVRYAYWEVIVRQNTVLVVAKGAPNQAIKWIHSIRVL